MPQELPILTLRVDGPEIRKGRVSVPDLIKICSETQNAVTRQAEALEGRRTIHPGPATEQIRQECTLELMAIGEGSTELRFGLGKTQIPIPFPGRSSFGAEAIKELILTIRSLNDEDGPKETDAGVLQGIYGLTSLVESGRFTTIDLVAPTSAGASIKGSITSNVRGQVASRLSGPSHRVVQVDGILDMADFNRRERKCRIDPAVGTSVVCTFGPENEAAVQELLRRPVRARGLAKIQSNADRIESLSIQTIEPLPTLSLGEGNFLRSLNIDQLAQAQDTKPIPDTRTLAGLLTDDEIDDFVADIYEAREPV